MSSFTGLPPIAASGSKLIEYEAYTGQADDPQRLTIDHVPDSALCWQEVSEGYSTIMVNWHERRKAIGCVEVSLRVFG
jgi:hypothetical protein